ncbi:anti-sigma factor domain-containing protein [Mesorhizobium sp. ANAO-SY3R2]|uniref:anti-sigma factor n=1 Tax=Mesorhizobium sp. ANAO-SY3R2 TaxID=3166644 RepID=UPI00366E5E6F
MTLAEENGPEQRGDDILAAEYVLGVLPAEERQRASARIESDPAFARMVDRWEVHFAPLADAYPEVEPPVSVRRAIHHRVSREAAAQVDLWSSLVFWRGLAAAALTVLVLSIAMPYMSPPAEAPREMMVASLAAEGSPVKYMVMYDGGTGEIGLSHVAGERAAGKDFELWMVEGGKPISMGVIPVGSTMHMPVSPDMREKLAAGSVLAVSLEPSGGSPTGLPTGPVVATGNLRNI